MNEVIPIDQVKLSFDEEVIPCIQQPLSIQSHELELVSNSNAESESKVMC